MRRILKRLMIGAFGATILYFSAVALEYRNYWAALFWDTYLSWVPAYDIVKGPQESIKTRAQYKAATEFIRERSLTPLTAKFCPFAEAKFGTYPPSKREAMVGCVDMQNAYGALIRGHFTAVFQKDDSRAVELIKWAGEDGAVWR
jgi:hypothetical protein